MKDDDDTVIELLEQARPLPRPSFRGDLRRHLLAQGRGDHFALRRARLTIAGLASSGTALLALGAVGLTGIGPFGA